MFLNYLLSWKTSGKCELLNDDKIVNSLISFTLVKAISNLIFNCILSSFIR